MAIGSEPVKIKSRKLNRMSFHENSTPQNFLAIRYIYFWSIALSSVSTFHTLHCLIAENAAQSCANSGGPLSREQTFR